MSFQTLLPLSKDHPWGLSSYQPHGHRGSVSVQPLPPAPQTRNQLCIWHLPPPTAPPIQNDHSGVHGRLPRAWFLLMVFICHNSELGVSLGRNRPALCPSPDPSHHQILLVLLLQDSAIPSIPLFLPLLPLTPALSKPQHGLLPWVLGLLTHPLTLQVGPPPCCPHLFPTTGSSRALPCPDPSQAAPPPHPPSRHPSLWALSRDPYPPCSQARVAPRTGPSSLCLVPQPHGPCLLSWSLDVPLSWWM